LIIVLCRSQPIILAPSTFPYHFHHRHGHTMFPSSCMLSLLLSLHPPFSFRIYILCCTSGLTSVNETGRIYSFVGKVNSIHFIITGVNHYAHNLHISMPSSLHQISRQLFSGQCSCSPFLCCPNLNIFFALFCVCRISALLT